MPKKCPAIDSSTPHKKQLSSDDKPSKKHSRKSTESCRSEKLSQRHSTAKYQSPEPCPVNAPSSCSPENHLAINCAADPTPADSVQFSCNCSSSKKRKTLGRQCSAGSPTIACPGSYDKACKLGKSKSSSVRNECCCGVPRKKKNSEKRVKVKSGTRNKPPKDCIKPPKDPKPCKAAKKPKPRKVILKDPKICEHKEEAKTFDRLVRPCNCCDPRIESDRKKSRGCCPNLFCCPCFNKFWNKKRNKKKKESTAPCKRYLCLHNPGRSDCDESIPCVKCTHNCNERWLEKSGKESPAESKVIQMYPESSSNTLASSRSTKTICEASDTGRHDAVNSREIKTKEKCRSYKADDISEERSVRREKKREEKCKRKNVRESKKRKSCKHSKKSKKVAYDTPESTVVCASAPTTVENKCCPCKIPEKEVKLKTKPCMKCPNNMIGKKGSCKKLTFASCTELRDYKLENKKKKRSAMGIIFDVIFWPYAFWPRRDPCK